MILTTSIAKPRAIDTHVFVFLGSLVLCHANKALMLKMQMTTPINVMITMITVDAVRILSSLCLHSSIVKKYFSVSWRILRYSESVDQSAGISFCMFSN